MITRQEIEHKVEIEDVEFIVIFYQTKNNNENERHYANPAESDRKRLPEAGHNLGIKCTFLLPKIIE